MTIGSTTTTLLNSASYSGNAGAAGHLTGETFANGTYNWSASFDGGLRLTGVQIQSGGTTRYSQTRTFDAANNVTSAATTLPAGTDNQTFCYDAMDRLTWGGSTGTPTCGSSLTAGTLTSAQYQQYYAYDTLDRLTQGPFGPNYTYGGPLDGVTSAGSGTNTYTAAYDAAGNMTCRALTTSQTCSGTPTGQALTYDTLERQISWQDATPNPQNTAAYGYNGEGERVRQVLTTPSGTTTTTYLGDYQEISLTGSATTTTTYYTAGAVTAVNVNGTLSYLADDDLGSVSVALDGAGNVTASELYAPYGAVRYSQGTMPTSYGFTGQRLDTSGLNYFHARYYDSVVGQFTSADEVAGPNRYAYVSGNPETLTDPSGNCPWCISIAIGALAGAVIGGAVSAVSQQLTTGHVDWGQVGHAALTGAVTGAIAGSGAAIMEGVAGLVIGGAGLTGAAATAVTVGGVVAGNVVGSVASTIVGNKMDGKPAFDGLAQNVLLGLATEGAVRGGGAAFKALRKGADDTAGAAGAAKSGAKDNPAPAGGSKKGPCNSFSPDTPVATPTGEEPIGQIQVGDQVLAYNSQTGQSKAETVDHIFINHDTNLVDVTIAPVAPPPTPPTPQAAGPTQKQLDAAVAAHGSQAPPANTTTETLHTTTEHPFLTADRGFVDAAHLQVGELIQRLDGSLGVVIAVLVTPGAAVRYNLTVHEWHTFAVGEGQWVVHNTEPCRIGNPADNPARPPRFNGRKPTYDVNPAHDPHSPSFNPKKTPLPADAQQVYQHAVPDDAVNAKHWYGTNNQGHVYRFSNANNGTAHFSGRSNVSPGLQLNGYVKARLGIR